MRPTLLIANVAFKLRPEKGDGRELQVRPGFLVVQVQEPDGDGHVIVFTEANGKHYLDRVPRSWFEEEPSKIVLGEFRDDFVAAKLTLFAERAKL